MFPRGALTHACLNLLTALLRALMCCYSPPSLTRLLWLCLSVSLSRQVLQLKTWNYIDVAQVRPYPGPF